MRIAHVSDCYLPRLGGIEVQVHDLATRQLQAGHQVTVVTTVPGERAGADPGLRVHRPRGRDHAGAPVRYSRSLSARRQLRGEEFDVVHVHASTFSPLAFLTAHATARAGIPTVVTLHSLWAYAAPAFHAADRLTGWGRWPVLFTAVSHAAADQLAAVTRAPVAVLPNGIDPAEWRVAPAERDPADVRLVSVMRLAPRKRPRALVAILAEARRRVPAGVRLRMDVVGDGPERRSLQRALRRTGLDWVHLTGPLDRDAIRGLYERADLFLAPATLESFGIAALEARTAGIPVLARAGTGVAEFVRDGREGRLASSDAELVDALAQLATTPTLRARIAGHNRSVEPPMTWPAVLARCNDLYRQAAELAAPERPRWRLAAHRPTRAPLTLTGPASRPR